MDEPGRAKEFDDRISDLYRSIRPKLQARVEGFRSIWVSRDEKAVLSELKFCLLTPQSKALSCWEAVGRMNGINVCGSTDRSELEACLKGVRFHHNKAKYLLEALKRFEASGKGVCSLLEGFSTNIEARDWLVGNIKGMGLKEASHFLRNVGLGEDLAILDRHILRNLAEAGVIGEVPKSLSRREYLDIESKMSEYSESLGIPLAHLDLLLWYKQTGCVFK